MIINTSITDAGSAQELELAGRQVDKHLNNDSQYPSVLDQFRILPQGGATVSGLSENDYPVGVCSRYLRHLHTDRKVPLPADLLHHFQHMQCNCMMGLFPDIKRAWLTIDSDIYVWMYEDGSDLAYFDGLHDAILSVGLVKPKPGVFKEYIEYLLCLATPSEIVLLGLSFNHPSEKEASSSVYLLPEPLFSVSADGTYILTITGTADGRIFMGSKDGSLWELVYQAEFGWFSRKCYKVNHSRSSLSYILPSFLTLVEDDPVIQIEVDRSRHIVYTLTEKGHVSVYDLDQSGNSTNRVLSLSHHQITSAALSVAKTIDKANFKSLVGICAICKNDSPSVHLVIVTGTGVRLYYTTTGLHAPFSRPSQLTLVHVRLPPGFSANALTHRPTKVHKALYSYGTAILCASESSESDVIWAMSRDQFPFQPSLAESQVVVAVDGFVWAAADVTASLWCTSLNPPTSQGTVAPLLVTQHHHPPRQLVLMTASGTHILTVLRPVDQLKYLLQECGGVDSAAVKEFFSSISPTQACAMALILAMDASLAENQVADAATDALFRYGSVSAPPNAPFSFNQNRSLNYTFQPSQVSTPMAPFQPGSQQSLNQSAGGQDPFAPSSDQHSPLHDSLYLYLSRILRPVWTTSMVAEETRESQSFLKSVLSAEEVSFLARHVELMSKFMTSHLGPGQKLTRLSTSGPSNVHGKPDGGVGERASLLALTMLLTRCLEVLRLWTVLITHDLSLVSKALPKNVFDQVRGVTLRDLVLNGNETCRNLVLALMDRYHGDNASVDSISMRLRDVCPSLHRAEDAKLSKANEIVLRAKNTPNKAEKDAAFAQAVELCKQIGHSVNVSGVCAQLASGGFYEGVVDLCLSVAGQRDADGQALHFYRSGSPGDDPRGQVAFMSRMECYRVIINHLNQLAESCQAAPSFSPSLPFKPGPPSSAGQRLVAPDAGLHSEKMIELVCRSGDELAHIALYEWLVETGRTDRLLSISSSFLEAFLTKADDQRAPLNDLLWRYYERNREYYKAAKTLAFLADQPSDIPLSTRIEHLSRALMCLSSSQMTTSNSHADFVLHLEEKKDVARVQLMVLEAVQGKGCGSDVLNSLNTNLLDISALYEKFAEPWALWECKLAIVHCAGHSEPQLIRTIWTNILENELAGNTQRYTTPFCIDSTSSKIKNLAKKYSLSPNFFPLEHIIRVCELKSVRMRINNTSWLVDTLQGCGIPISKLIALYHKLYTMNDSVWEVERSAFHLLRVLTHVFSMVTGSSSINSQERRALREECLDYIAAYFTDLDSSADPSAAIISAHLKACQAALENS